MSLVKIKSESIAKTENSLICCPATTVKNTLKNEHPQGTRRRRVNPILRNVLCGIPLWDIYKN
ncbi:MAG: hypothetical protein KAR42_05615 [candidate division Zixibacteria bacterium]|nr:hypothetical protein [candidate division Zixibacteria bacterium]